MKSTISKIIGFLVAIHLLTCLIVIFLPQFVRPKIVYTVYKRYLLPGPFFSGNTIKDTYQLSVMWQDENNSWSKPVNPALNNYTQFTSGDIRLMNRSRMDRMLYQQMFIKDSVSNKWIIDNDKMSSLKRYYKTHYVPSDVDSIRLMITHQDSGDFNSKTDILQTIQF